MEATVGTEYSGQASFGRKTKCDCSIDSQSGLDPIQSVGHDLETLHGLAGGYRRDNTMQNMYTIRTTGESYV